MTFFPAEFGDDPATDLLPVKNITFSNESKSQTSSETPTEGIHANEDFGVGRESDPFTDKMVSGTNKLLTRQKAAALKHFCSCSSSVKHFKKIHACCFDLLLHNNSRVTNVSLTINGQQKA